MTNIEKISVSKIGFWLIVPFMGFISHTVVRIPPTIFLFLLAFFMVPFFVSSKPKIKYGKIIFLPLIISSYFILTQSFLSPPLFRFLAIVCTFLYFVLVIIYSQNIEDEFLFKCIKIFIQLSLVLLVADTAWRFTFPDDHYNQFFGIDNRWIYKYKQKGLMYGDSNGAGLHLLCLLFFIYYLKNRLKWDFPTFRIIIVLLIIVSFSRAAWIATFFGLAIFDLLRRKSLISRVIVLLAIAGTPLAIILIGSMVIRDGSFLSKLGILFSALDFAKSLSLSEFLFGIGFFNTIERMGIYGHNFWLIYFLESGIIGFILVLTFFVFIYINTGKKAGYVLLPFFIASLSAITTFIPYFYGILALIYIIEKRIGENCFHSAFIGK